MPGDIISHQTKRWRWNAYCKKLLVTQGRILIERKAFFKTAKANDSLLRIRQAYPSAGNERSLKDAETIERGLIYRGITHKAAKQGNGSRQIASPGIFKTCDNVSIREGVPFGGSRSAFCFAVRSRGHHGYGGRRIQCVEWSFRKERDDHYA